MKHPIIVSQFIAKHVMTKDKYLEVVFVYALNVIIAVLAF
jgi:hypothetical protein